jgi:hypothetical protein
VVDAKGSPALAEPDTGEPEPTPIEFTSRLLDAKRRVRQGRQPRE